ncbi:MAG: hypothetical protein HZA93_20965 [Verrucomicrobia bacterium]|nr:hypothetical protein [Verrucomicrobiota bacterium]
MKSLVLRVSLAAVISGLAFTGTVTPTLAADEAPSPRQERREPRPGPMAPAPDQAARQLHGQLERIEQRLNQLAERQEQMMRQSGGPRERPGPRAQPGPEAMRGPAMPPAAMHRAFVPDAAGPVARHQKAIHDLLGLGVLIFALCNILMAIWIFTDIRKRGEGPAIFVAMALIAGIPAAMIYALTRIADKKPPVA